MSGNRKCNQCGNVLHRWPIDPRRRRNENDDLICEQCAKGKRTRVNPHESMVSCVHCGSISDHLTVQAGLVVCRDGCQLRAVAHDSGSNEVLAHCPFCGSGDLVGRSDGSAECRFCFAGETEFITWDGVRTLKETVGTTQRVLASGRPTEAFGQSEHHGSFGGVWVDAEIQSFGVQPLLRVTIARAGVTKEIYATKEHRWYINPRHGSAYRYDRKKMVLTNGLSAGDRLAPNYPTTRVKLNRDTVPSPFGVAHGFVYGDGSLTTRGGSEVVLWGHKDSALLPYFGASRHSESRTANGVVGIRIGDLPAFFKDQPPRGESLSYLYGWLAGYFAADGCIDKNGTSIALDSADRGSLEQVQDLCAQLGIGTYGITRSSRLGYGAEPSDMWRLTFIGRTLTPDFFIIREHRDRFVNRATEREPAGWKVVSVEETDRVEEVFCAVVPGHENFTLAGNINVMNCKQCFTVQVQPMSPAHPQTVNGEPVQWPGQPGGPLTPEQEKAGLEIQLGPEGQDEPQVEGEAQPQVEGDLDASFKQEVLNEEPQDEDEGSFPPKKPRPFPPKGSARTASGPSDWDDAFEYAQSRGASPSRARDFADSEPAPGYITQEWSRWSRSDEESDERFARKMYMVEGGLAMPEESFVRRLAVRFADDPAVVIEDIKAGRG